VFLSSEWYARVGYLVENVSPEASRVVLDPEDPVSPILEQAVLNKGARQMVAIASGFRTADIGFGFMGGL
jgi:hypothetical protein